MISLFENDCLCSNKSQTPFERACTRACNLNSIRLCFGLFDYVIISWRRSTTAKFANENLERPGAWLPLILEEVIRVHALLPLIKNMINVSCRSIYFNTNGELTYYLIKYNVVMNTAVLFAHYLFIIPLKHDSWYTYFATTEYEIIRLRHWIPVSIVLLKTAIILLHKWLKTEGDNGNTCFICPHEIIFQTKQIFCSNM